MWRKFRRLVYLHKSFLQYNCITAAELLMELAISAKTAITGDFIVYAGDSVNSFSDWQRPQDRHFSPDCIARRDGDKNRSRGFINLVAGKPTAGPKMRAFGVHFARIRWLGESPDSILRGPLRSRGADPEKFGPLVVGTSKIRKLYMESHVRSRVARYRQYTPVNLVGTNTV